MKASEARVLIFCERCASAVIILIVKLETAERVARMFPHIVIRALNIKAPRLTLLYIAGRVEQAGSAVGG